MLNRRQLISSTALAASTYKRILGANDRVTVGLIGSGGQGRGDWERFLSQPDVNPGAACDVYQTNLDKGLSLASGRAKSYTDFRKLLEQKDIDAVIVATPDHWHALPTVMACQAGKDVYVEKPLALTIHEGQLMYKAARKYKRVVQVGSQQRSGEHYKQAVEYIRSGKLGKVAHIQAGFFANSMPGFGAPPDGPPPQDLNWDMWLGPAPIRPYNPLRCQYHFRWFWDYSGGQMTNWGAHNLDIVRWAMDVRGPQEITGLGGRYALQDLGEVPDVQEVVYGCKDFVVTWSVRMMNAMAKTGVLLEFHGSKGNLILSRGGFQVVSEKWGPNKVNALGEELNVKGADQFVPHVRNFLDCVKSRQRPNADVEEGHLTAAMCHLGNISTRLRRSLRWDTEKEEIIGDTEANGWLSRPYREPWRLSADV